MNGYYYHIIVFLEVIVGEGTWSSWNSSQQKAAQYIFQKEKWRWSEIYAHSPNNTLPGKNGADGIAWIQNF